MRDGRLDEGRYAVEAGVDESPCLQLVGVVVELIKPFVPVVRPIEDDFRGHDES